MQFETFSAKETETMGYHLGKIFQAGQVVALIGELAAGKTTLVKGICQGLDVRQPVDSPTFTLVNEYHGRLPVYHIDCYREQRLTEWLELGINEYFYGDGVTIVEWAERIETLLPPDTIWIYIKHDIDFENHRVFEIVAPKEIYQKFSAKFSLSNSVK